MTEVTNHLAFYRHIMVDGFWRNNPALVQLLGLCPLLAVTTTVVNALGLSLATTLVLAGANVSASLFRKQITPAVRLPALVMIIAALVTCTELLMQALAYELYQILGIFMPLIVTNCVILGRADAFGRKNAVVPAALDGFMMGLGFTIVLITIGGLRELIGQGTLLSGMHLLLGESAKQWVWTVSEHYQPCLVLMLPPGAFFTLGALVAFKRCLDRWLQERVKTKTRIPLLDQTPSIPS